MTNTFENVITTGVMFYEAKHCGRNRSTLAPNPDLREWGGLTA